MNIDEHTEQELDQLRMDLTVARELLDKANAELEQIKGILANPTAVHINLMRGTIAYTPAGLSHVLGLLTPWPSDRPLWDVVYTFPADQRRDEQIMYRRLCDARFDVSFTIHEGGVGMLAIPQHEVARLKERQAINPPYWYMERSTR